jgi:WD40 repeat protein
MRYFVFLLVVCAGVFAAVAYFKPYEENAGIAAAGFGGPQGPAPKAEAPRPADKAALTPDAFLWTPRHEDFGGRVVPVAVIGNAQMMPLDRQEVPSERDGKLLVIGTEIAPGEQVAKDRRYTATVGYLLVAAGDNEQLPADQVVAGQGNSRWRRFRESDTPQPGAIFVQRVKKEYKRLDKGDEVKAGQTVALVDPELALNDVSIKAAALDAAESERRASVQTKLEAERRVAAMRASRSKVVGSVSEDDFQGAILTANRYAQEEVAKTSAVIKAQQELIQAVTILGKHEIHATVPGVIKIVYKNRGDAVKTLEPVMQIQSREHLRIEGLMDVQETGGIKPEHTEVIVEPTQPIRPKQVLEGHIGEVNCVAVGHGRKPVILSGGEDSTLRGWSAATGGQLWVLRYRNAVRSVAATGPGAKRGLALVGCADGSASLVDLDRLDDFTAGKTQEQPRPQPLDGRHRGAVDAVAFSPDGTICASGGDDRRILLWDPETGKLVAELPAFHRAPVTLLQFMPPNRLFSAGGDHQLGVWSVEPGKEPALVNRFDRREGTVARVGVSPDGKQILFDQGKEIRLLSTETGQPEGIIRNPTGDAKFTTMALFDPDGLTVLTNGGAEGRLQLWRTPTHESARSAELRQLVWPRGSATSAAFSPDGSLCVTGMQDGHVLVWPMPERKPDSAGKPQLVEAPIRSHIKNVEPFIDSSNRQVRVWVELENRDDRLVPGGMATLVILPDAK